ncbi:hypothetical protein L7E55_09355 [Pelotomaculum isophthalicicum JI]|uniref:Uncharacterized protein n=1 Tax=Pelotomaculum isophthalicicum JI TaxID=947010 RepID=A0A9X4JW65_9FIRM|nr:hypothetical protein [Pelotomaculum isophthalicicum]MDF9408563.1 hypothetical protein [Pelotomaculum isophthalicicum JI]
MEYILNHLNAQFNWLKSCQILNPGSDADGAIKKYPDQGWIMPYFSNFAAMAMLEDPTSHPLVERYLNWYLRHLEKNGTMLDYHYDDNFNGKTAGPDSEDSYAGTYLSLVCAYHFRTGQTGWVRENLPSLKKVASVIINLMDRDGLTFALAGYRVKYLMDNCEAYRGLKDFADLMYYLGDQDAGIYQSKAKAIASGIERALWNSSSRCYYASKTGLFKNRVNLKKFYPDAACQVFPVLFGLLKPDSERAAHLHKVFNNSQPDWVNIKPPDFPWMLLGYYACLHGDHERALEKIRQGVESYIEPKSGCWYCGESAFFVLTCTKLIQLKGAGFQAQTIFWPGPL